MNPKHSMPRYQNIEPLMRISTVPLYVAFNQGEENTKTPGAWNERPLGIEFLGAAPGVSAFIRTSRSEAYFSENLQNLFRSEASPLLFTDKPLHGRPTGSSKPVITGTTSRRWNTDPSVPRHWPRCVRETPPKRFQVRLSMPLSVPRRGEVRAHTPFQGCGQYDGKRRRWRQGACRGILRIRRRHHD